LTNRNPSNVDIDNNLKKMSWMV